MIKARIKKWNKKSVGLPGIISGMDLDFYHSKNACCEPSVSSSGLKTIFAKSPAHYFVSSPYNPKAVEDEETDALRFGRAAHHLLFGETAFSKLFAAAPETMGAEPFSLRRKVCKIWRQDREAEGKTFIKREELDHIMGMRDALAQHTLVKAGILNGYIETSWFIKHAKTGIWLKIRPDAAPNDSLDFVDLKCVRSVDYSSLQQALYNYGYFIQAGLTALVVREILGHPINSFTFVFQEKEPPYDIAPVTLKESEIDRGIRVAEHTINRFAECLKANRWPGRYESEDAAYIEMPTRLQEAIDARIR